MLSRTLPAGFIQPCLPIKAPEPPTGALWLHEIKHDGFRVIARKDGARVRLYSRPGNDLTDRFSLIVEAMARLRSRSCIVDGEAVACDERGIAAFDRIRYRRYDGCVLLYAFDLIELNGDDLRRDPLAVRRATLASVLAKAGAGVRFNEHMEFDDGETVFHQEILTIDATTVLIAGAGRLAHRPRSSRFVISLGFVGPTPSGDVRKACARPMRPNPPATIPTAIAKSLRETSSTGASVSKIIMSHAPTAMVTKPTNAIT
jgi:bifunctional non-homologous end joining protein LigD